jgi:hypothetical protein
MKSLSAKWKCCIWLSLTLPYNHQFHFGKNLTPHIHIWCIAKVDQSIIITTPDMIRNRCKPSTIFTSFIHTILSLSLSLSLSMSLQLLLALNVFTLGPTAHVTPPVHMNAGNLFVLFCFVDHIEISQTMLHLATLFGTIGSPWMIMGAINNFVP